MNRHYFEEQVIQAGLRFPVKGVRINKDVNYGLDVQTYSLWLVGEHSADKTLLMGVDCYALCIKFRGIERAEKELAKLTRWLTNM